MHYFAGEVVPWFYNSNCKKYFFWLLCERVGQIFCACGQICRPLENTYLLDKLYCSSLTTVPIFCGCGQASGPLVNTSLLDKLSCSLGTTVPMFCACVHV